MSDEEKEEGGFTVNDRRSANQSDDDAQALDEERKKEEAKAQQAAAQEQAARQAQQAPGQENFEIDFSTFIMSLASSAFYHLGDMPDPMTGQKEENLPAVKQTIDILGMLQSKTKSNLTAEEAKLIEQIIYELQMKYVAKTK